MNIPTIIIAILIAIAFVYSIRSIVKNRKSGGCGGACGGCPYSGNCMTAFEASEKAEEAKTP